MMTKFADQLFEDLMHEHGSALQSVSAPERRPVRTRHRVARPVWVTTGLAAVAGAVTGALVLFGGAAPAYAVTKNTDGTVSVSVSQASAIDAANVKLKALKVRAVVVPVRAGCPSLGSLIVHDPAAGPISISTRWHGGHISSIAVDARGIPAGDILVLAFDGTHGMVGSAGPVEGHAPRCVSLSTPPGAITSGGTLSSGH